LIYFVGCCTTEPAKNFGNGTISTSATRPGTSMLLH